MWNGKVTVPQLFCHELLSERCLLGRIVTGNFFQTSSAMLQSVKSMKLTDQQLQSALQWLEAHRMKKRGGKPFSPHYNATSWDLDDLFRAFRRDAVGSRDIIWQAVSERTIKGDWPKLQSRDSFWLSQRWSMAVRYCQEVLEQSKTTATSEAPSNHPKVDMEAVKWLLMDLWDQSLVDVWIQENARDSVVVEWPEDDNEYQLEAYFRKIGAL